MSSSYKKRFQIVHTLIHSKEIKQIARFPVTNTFIKNTETSITRYDFIYPCQIGANYRDGIISFLPSEKRTGNEPIEAGISTTTKKAELRSIPLSQ